MEGSKWTGERLGWECPGKRLRGINPIRATSQIFPHISWGIELGDVLVAGIVYHSASLAHRRYQLAANIFILENE